MTTASSLASLCALVGAVALTMPSQTTLAVGMPQRGIAVEAPSSAAGTPHEAVSAALASCLSRVAVRWELEPVEGSTPDTDLSGGDSYVARSVPCDTRPSARQGVWVDTVRGGRVVASQQVRMAVKAYALAWVARGDMVAGTRLVDGLVERREVDIAAGGAAAWDGELASQSLRAPVLAGQYLQARHLSAARAVQAGDAVVLVHREGALEVRRDAAALQEGDVGARIAVRPVQGTAAVMARVISRGTVELVK